MKELVLLGGGHSQVEVLRQWAMHPMPDAALTVVTRDLLAPYSGMLPGFIAGHYRYEDCHIDVRPLAKAAGARLCQSEIGGLDLKNNRILCPNRPDVLFDILSINTGSRPAMENIPGAREYALPVKPVDEFIRGWDRIREEALASEKEYRIVLVGAGAGGVELALTMHHRLTTESQRRGQDASRFQFDVVTRAPEILSTHNKGVQRRVVKALAKAGIDVHYNQEVTRVAPDALVVESGEPHAFNALIWVTHASAPDWVAESGLATDDLGFILVDDMLRSVSHPHIFAAGDVATMESSPRPKSGVYAVRQGPFLSENLRHAVRGEESTPFAPQKRFLSLMCLGPEEAVASKGPFVAQGRTMWTWKDHIDRKFMRMYDASMVGMTDRDENMAMPVMHCAGCGSKVGQDLLSETLTKLEPYPAEGVARGLDHPDDAAVIEYPAGTQTVHTVDHFRALVDDPYVLGKITAHHCLSDLYAMGATPHNALASVIVPHGPAVQQSAILSDLLQGVNEVLCDEETALVGGHTTEGDELVFGLTVNGYAKPEELLPKTGIQPGDVLILTKPLGTGAIFAADMRKQARSHWIDGAVASMLQSNREAARVLREAGAHAVTDITGFGLMGHLREMLAEAQCGVELRLDDIPLLDGALECSEMGVRSTLFPENLQAEIIVANRNEVLNKAVYPLLFDPQTSGGLLAAVQEAKADDVCRATRGWIVGSAADHSGVRIV